MQLTIHGQKVEGVGITSKTLCAHYHSQLDIIAIRFKCCGRWFPCRDCHNETAGHGIEVWAIGERDARAILCGECGQQLSITEYLGCGSTCPECKSNFNPGCANHYADYFQM